MEGLRDQAARTAIREDIRMNLMVEAGAGSGKTSEMANRVIALVQGGYRTIDQIVAITFTNKAANELRERVRKALEKSYCASQNPLEKAALENIHKCFIGTIHSFCAKLLKERPIEAGIDPAFEEIDDTKDDEIIERIWNQYVTDADEAQNQILSEMDEFGIPQDVAKKVLKMICNFSDVDFSDREFLVSIEEQRQVVEEVYLVLQAQVENAYLQIPQAVLDGTGRPDDMMSKLIEFKNKSKNRLSLTLMQQYDLLRIFSTKTSYKIVQKNWAEDVDGKAKAKELSESFAQFREERILPVIEQNSSFIYAALLIPFATQARSLYEQYKKSVAALNFQDLLRKSADTLRDFPEVRRYFQRKYKTLLVDEFQDTDPIQAEMLLYLTGMDVNETNWNKLVPLEGSLFVVGDPKQSIYAFRRADLEIYERFKTIIMRTGGKVVELIANFRSTEELGHWYNEVFAELFFNDAVSVSADGPDGEKRPLPHQVAFSGLQAMRTNITGALSGVRVCKIDAENNKEIIEAEYKLLPRMVQWLVHTQMIADGNSARPATYRDIMVLAMKKKPLDYLSSSLIAHGIPVRTIGTDIITRAPLFDLFANVIKQIAYPEENAYVYRVMNSEVFQFSDTDILRYRALGGNFLIRQDIEALMQQPDADDKDRALLKRIKACFDMLIKLNEWSRSLSPGALTQVIITELGLLGKHLGSPAMLEGLDSFMTLVEAIRLKDINELWNLSAFIDHLVEMINHGQEEELNLEGEGQNAVTLMNVHKAKGLEAPIVILAAPYGASSPGTDYYVERTMDEDQKDHYKGYARIRRELYLHDTVEYTHSQWDDVANIVLLKDQYEEVRKKYVAATRARNALIIMDNAVTDKPGKTKPSKNPWKDLVDRVSLSTSRPLEEEVLSWAEANPENMRNNTGGETAVNIPESLGAIRERRTRAFKENKKTYNSWQPSEKHGRLEAASEERNEEEMLEADLRTSQNTIAWSLGRDGSEETGAQKLLLGTVLHKLFEILLTDETMVPLLIEELCAKSDLPGISEKELMFVVESFQNTGLWERVRQSEERYMEVPFSYKIPAGETFLDSTAENDIYANGYIDLVFREGNSWTIIDYKTCAHGEVKSKLEAYYAPQLAIYKRAWEQLSGEPVGKTEIFFVEKSNRNIKCKQEFNINS